MLVEFETDIGAKTICPSVVPNEIAVRRLTEDPAKRVGRFVVYCHLRRARDCEVFRRDEGLSLEAAVGQMQTHPVRHILNIGVDVAGASNVVGHVNERTFDAAVWRIALTFRVIGSGLYRLSRVRGLFHPQWIEQLLTAT